MENGEIDSTPFPIPYSAPSPSQTLKPSAEATQAATSSASPDLAYLRPLYLVAEYIR